MKEDKVQKIIDRLGNKILESALKFIRGKNLYEQMRLALDIHGAIAHKDITKLLRSRPINALK